MNDVKESKQDGPDKVELDRSQLLGLIMDGFRQTALHYGLWFAETVHHCGLDKALEAEERAAESIVPLYLKRMSKILGFELKDGLPAALADMAPAELAELAEGAAVNWLAVDGLWFQSVENMEGMDAAKRCNDACWTRFSAIEAEHIKKRLGLPERAGVAGLKLGLMHRLYARINEWEIVEETETSLVFRMRQCRVQNARKRRNLPDYPCKSGGMAEYVGFARQMDSRFKVFCLACPPDEHPDDWFCSWRFELQGD